MLKQSYWRASSSFLTDNSLQSRSENSSQPRRDIAGQIWGHPQFMNGQNVRFVKYLDVSFSSPRLHQSLRRFDRSRNGLRVQGTKVQSSGPPWTLTGNPNTFNCERQSALASTNGDFIDCSTGLAGQALDLGGTSVVGRCTSITCAVNFSNTLGVVSPGASVRSRGVSVTCKQ